MQPQQQLTLAYILKGYPRISETFISNEILLLEDMGFTMRIFSMRQPRESFSHDSVKKIRASVTYLPTELDRDFYRLLYPNLFLAAKYPSHFRKALLYANNNARDKNLLATLKHLFQAGYMTNNYLLNEKQICHLHGHFAHSPTSVTLFASILSGLPFSFTAHAKDIYTSKPHKIASRIAQATFVVTCTKYNKDYLLGLNQKPTTPIYCLYHGSDLALFTNDGSQITCKTPYKILTVARLTTKKGLPTVYRALAQLRDRGIAFSHTLIGDGDDRDLIASLIDKLQLGDCCRLLGTRTHAEVLDQFRHSDLFVLGCEIAGNGDRDGIPNVLVESLAMGVPAVATNVSAIPEIIVDGQTGLTVPPSNPEKLADAMLRLLSDQPLRSAFIANGRRLVQEQFDNRFLIKQLAQLFRKHNQNLAEA